MNTSPEPVTNVGVSAAEDLTVLGVVTLAWQYPWAAAAIAFVLLVVGLGSVAYFFTRIRRGWHRLGERLRQVTVADLRISADQRRARLARRHHRLATESMAHRPEEVARSVVAVHATDPASVHIRLRHAPGLPAGDDARGRALRAADADPHARNATNDVRSPGGTRRPSSRQPRRT